MSIMDKVIARIKGGLGNQLFCYAAARRLAIVNNVELVIDDVTGFLRDYRYQRRYALDSFNITARRANSSERMEPFERYRRGIFKFISGKKPFERRKYLEQEGMDFDRRLLDFKVKGTSYLDGYWQSEKYFKDVENFIRNDLKIKFPLDMRTRQLAAKIQKRESVALHIRCFDLIEDTVTWNMSPEYYRKAIDLIEKKINSPHYFIFSDHPDMACKKLELAADQYTMVSNNKEERNASEDLWLMAQCKHFIIANSTFSWWGAWLGNQKGKIVVAPDREVVGKMAWGFKGLIPDDWIRI